MQLAQILQALGWHIPSLTLTLSFQVTVLTQLQKLCGCSDVIVSEVALECQSASEGVYTATVLNLSEDVDLESLVEELYDSTTGRWIDLSSHLPPS